MPEVIIILFGLEIDVESYVSLEFRSSKDPFPARISYDVSEVLNINVINICFLESH